MDLIKKIKPKTLANGITGYYAHGDKTTFGYIEIKKGSSVPLHKHINEQITYIIEGQLEMIINGEPHTLTAGMYHIIPSDITHSAFAVTDCKIIDSFSPVREDYR